VLYGTPSCKTQLVLAEFLTYAVHEQLDPAAARAHVNVEVLTILEELTELTEYTRVPS
jgi:hypothetical protein